MGILQPRPQPSAARGSVSSGRWTIDLDPSIKDLDGQANGKVVAIPVAYCYHSSTPEFPLSSTGSQALAGVSVGHDHPERAATHRGWDRVAWAVRERGVQSGAAAHHAGGCPAMRGGRRGGVGVRRAARTGPTGRIKTGTGCLKGGVVSANAHTGVVAAWREQLEPGESVHRVDRCRLVGEGDWRGYVFDEAYTSVLKRAIRTLWIALDEMDQMWIPVYRSWRLNERHYGALQGLNKAETAERHGEAQVKIWRRSYDTPPPSLALDDERHPSRDARYANVPAADLPRTESLKDTVARFLPYWKETIAPAVGAGRRVLMVAHGNSLRALVKYLDNVSEDEIVGLNIPTGVPLIYELDDVLAPQRHYYLGDAAAIGAAQHAVANQAKAR